MDKWKDALKIGSQVCLNQYDKTFGVRFGIVEDIDHSSFLVKMSLNEKEDPIHYDGGYYRRYKYSKIPADGIVVI